jgi:hypothetical protein
MSERGRGHCSIAGAPMVGRKVLSDSAGLAFGARLGFDVALPARAYVDAVKAVVANKTASISPDAVERWSKWALAQADRIDPVRSARFLDAFESKDDAN